MILTIEKAFDAFEELRLKTLNETAQLSKEQLHFKPADNSWSITETLHHLYLSELGTHTYIGKKLQGADDLKKSGFKEAWNTFLLKMLLRSPMKFKLPRKAPIVPSGDMAYGDLVEQWNTLRKEMANQFDQFDVESAKKLSFKHPRIGYINAHQVLTFLTEHFKHHLQQIERIKSDSGFPKR
jgi:hypothetical protein